MEVLQHECGVALVRTIGQSKRNCIADAKQLIRLQRHRGRQGAGIASANFAVTKFNGDGAIDKLLSAPISPSHIALGHVRYATNGNESIEAMHPFISSNGRLALCGNFHFGKCYDAADGRNITEKIAALLERYTLCEALNIALADTSGGFVLCGITADGQTFAIRDRHGIRPAYYSLTDNYVAIASERFALEQILPDANATELPAGHAIISGSDGNTNITRILTPGIPAACPFERIYFSSAADKEIADVRQRLGQSLAAQISELLGPTPRPTLLTYVPNSAYHAWQGLANALGNSVIAAAILEKTISGRTFITGPTERAGEVSNAYRLNANAFAFSGHDIIIVDDSIVRGTTFRDSNLLPLLGTLTPGRIIIASSAPPVLFADYYGIDIPNSDVLIATKATDGHKNVDASRVAELIHPSGFTTPLSVVYQSVEALKAVLGPGYGTWVFTGDYPC